MSEEQLADFASTRRSGKPDYVKESPIPAMKAKRSKAAKKGAATRKRNSDKKTR